jgi:hypothetical protein
MPGTCTGHKQHTPHMQTENETDENHPDLHVLIASAHCALPTVVCLSVSIGRDVNSRHARCGHVCLHLPAHFEVLVTIWLSQAPAQCQQASLLTCVA